MYIPTKLGQNLLIDSDLMTSAKIKNELNNFNQKWIEANDRTIAKINTLNKYGILCSEITMDNKRYLGLKPTYFMWINDGE
jgi:hypothetical protein